MICFFHINFILISGESACSLKNRLISALKVIGKLQHAWLFKGAMGTSILTLPRTQLPFYPTLVEFGPYINLAKRIRFFFFEKSHVTLVNRHFVKFEVFDFTQSILWGEWYSQNKTCLGLFVQF